MLHMRKNVTLVAAFSVAYLVTKLGISLEPEVEVAVSGIVAGLVAYVIPDG